MQRGKIAIGLADDDALVDVQLTDGSRDVMLFASNGKAILMEKPVERTTAAAERIVARCEAAKGILSSIG